MNWMPKNLKERLLDELHGHWTNSNILMLQLKDDWHIVCTARLIFEALLFIVYLVTDPG